jgi:hypothetical protein
MKSYASFTARQRVIVACVALALVFCLVFCPSTTLAAEKGFIETLTETVAPGGDTQPEKPKTKPKKDPKNRKQIASRFILLTPRHCLSKSLGFCQGVKIKTSH